MIFVILALFTLSAAITFAATPLTIRLAKRFGLVDDASIRPHPATTHTGVIPRAGGIPIFLGFAVPILILFPLTAQTIGMLIGGGILVVIGLWDDRQSRSPYIRLVTNSLAAAVAVYSGIAIPYITNPTGGILALDAWRLTFQFAGTHSIVVWADLFAFCWILWNTNIIGWSGGIDGQLPGVVTIAAGVIGLLSLRYATIDPNQLTVTYLSFIAAGAFLGFLPWNFYPQKIMPGYGGKTLAGFLLAVLSILAFGKLGTALLILAIPITDAIFVFGRRLLSGHSPVWASSGHLHHHLLSRGWGKRQIAVFYWVVSAIAGAAALILNSRQKVFAIIAVLVVVFGFILWVNLFRKHQQR